MLKREQEITSYIFVGVEAQIYVENRWGDIILRDNPRFKSYEAAERFLDACDQLSRQQFPDRSKRRAAFAKLLDGMLDDGDDFESITLIECTQDGRRFRLEKGDAGT